METLNPRILDVEYAVRGPIVIRAAEIEKQIKGGNHSFPFDRVIRANIGDCHASGNQVPVTYIRQFLAGCTYPPLMDSPDFPSDIKQKVERLLSVCGGKSLGAYTESQGLIAVREDIATYIQERDGYPADTSDIYLCNGASDGIKTVIKLLMNNDATKPSGIDAFFIACYFHALSMVSFFILSVQKIKQIILTFFLKNKIYSFLDRNHIDILYSNCYSKGNVILHQHIKTTAKIQ
ncbi:unnamed protein product [Rotaria socialis]